ncbi:unannotated protein [freshwater metagenome]|uniref:Unannotated protein n=1 Tax=freshwater metagenome TaxID=449393 RepID=A0A6J7NU62_9ZZZZ
MPNDTFEAPRVMLTPTCSLMSAMVSRVRFTRDESAPIGIASGSMMMSSIGMPYLPVAVSTMWRTSSSLRIGSSGISNSSFGRAITAAPYFFTRGRMSSMRSSSAVMELTSALP